MTLTLATLLFAGAAQAAPPSSNLSSSQGALRWTVAESGGTVKIDGSSPKWTVSHEARADLSPVRTEHVNRDGARYTVAYDASGATVTHPGGETRLAGKGLWDSDTLDIRLGELVARGGTQADFQAIDLDGLKVYSFHAEVTEQTTCGAQACTEVELRLAGMLRYVGPSWTYRFGEDGQLLYFDGPAGTFAAGGAK